MMKYNVEYAKSRPMAFFIGSVLILLVLGIFYGLQLNIWLTVSLGFLISLYILDQVHERESAKGLSVEVVNREIRKFKNQEGVLLIRVRNDGWLPVLSGSLKMAAGDDMKFHHDLSLKIRNQTETVLGFSVMPKSAVTLQVPFTAKNRGVAKIFSTKMEIPRIFGFGNLALGQTGRLSHEVMIYPHRLHAENHGMDNRNMMGLFIQKNTLFTDPMLTIGIRDYQHTDSMRHIHWKASARTGRLKTRVNESTTHLSWMIAINLRSEKTYAPPANIEEIIEKVAYLAHRAAEQSIPYRIHTSMLTFDNETFFRVGEGTGRLHYRRTLESLSRINTVSFTLSFDRLLNHVLHHEDLPTHLIFTGKADPAVEAVLTVFESKGVEIFQLDAQDILPYSAKNGRGAGHG